jgi:uncharacterized phage protein gp47/JayE
MYEEYTYELILQDMLAKVPSDIDKREGSIIYDALAPAALKLAEAYFILNNNLNLVFLDTAEGEYLTRKCLEYGVERKEATYAIRKGTFRNSSGNLMDIPIDSRFRINDTTLGVVEKIDAGIFKLKAEQSGSVGNLYEGTMIPINYIDGLGTATLGEVLDYGEDAETDEALRERTRNNISNSSSDGNKNQYLKWSSEFSGIGRSKVFALWNGPNTVKVSITDSLNQVANTQLINDFQNYLDPGSNGLGNGKAPIGAKVTVTTGVKKDININAEIVLNQGYSQPVGVPEVISKYLSSITYLKNSISYIRLASEFLTLPSIAEVRNLTINGVTSDITLLDEDIPMLNGLNLVVVG